MKILECKFESDEDKYCKEKSFPIKYKRYKSDDSNEESTETGNETLKTKKTKRCKDCGSCSDCIWIQTNVQNAIGDFICEYMKNFGGETDKEYKRYETRLIKFTRKLSNPDKKEISEKEILIKDLIEIENKIWTGELWRNGIR